MNNNQIIDMQCNETTGRIMRPVAYIKSDFTSKFGIPRQSGLADLEAEIHFYPEYQNPEAVRGLEEYSHLWLIWEFSQAIRKEWSPTVRPPKLGGNTRVGVFATRSPFRPNPIGLSSVQLTGVTLNPQDGPVIHIQGADLLDGTPIYDIKPYIPYADSHPEARGSFATAHRDDHLQVQQKTLEEIIRKYFTCWLNKDEKPLTDIFAEDIIYSECYGPEYHGIRQIQQWFHDWNQKGTVQKWDVKQIYISRNTAIIEWYFQCNYCNTQGAFDGVTIAQFDENNKIYNLKEFQSKCDHEYPYEPV